MSDKIVRIGVGFLLFSNHVGIPKLFTVEELKDKPEIHKFKGMKSFPLETYEERDCNFQKTILRMLEEEIGISSEKVAIRAIEEKRFQLIPGRSDIRTVYGFGLFIGDPFQPLIPKDDDIKFSGWMTVDKLLQQYIRVETYPIICHFKKKHFYNLLKELSQTA